MEALGMLGMLGICSYEDIKRRRVQVLMVLGFGVIGLILHLIGRRIEITDILGGMSIGVAVFIVSVLSRERIGKGDALMIVVSGIYLGFWNNLFLLWGAIFLSGIVGMFLLMGGRRKKELPFAPFLLGVYVIMLLISGGTNVS